MRKLIDLSHTIENGLVTYRGLPAPIICDYLSREASRERYADNTSFQIGKIEMVANTGTYIDAPFHRYADGLDISELALESLAEIEALVVRVGPDVQAIDAAHVADLEVTDRAVLIQTEWSRHWNTERYYEGHPFLTEAAAVTLRDKAARIVGIDSYNIDDVGNGRRPVHSVLLGSGIPIVEHLCNLSRLPDRGFEFSAVPVKVQGFGSFPVRAYASLPI
jgi:arylformamidase